MSNNNFSPTCQFDIDEEIEKKIGIIVTKPGEQVDWNKIKGQNKLNAKAAKEV